MTSEDLTTRDLHASKRPCPLDCPAPSWGFCEHAVTDLMDRIDSDAEALDWTRAELAKHRRAIAKMAELVGYGIVLEGRCTCGTPAMHPAHIPRCFEWIVGDDGDLRWLNNGVLDDEELLPR
jgi:hypothetical protein